MPADRTIEHATLSALLESLPTPALVVDRRHRIRAANSALRARVLPAAAVTALRCFELLHGGGPRCPAAPSQCPLERCLGTGDPVPAVHAHLAGRATRLERILLRPLVEDGGRVVACLGTLEPASAGLRARGGPAESEVAVGKVRARLPRLARGTSGTSRRWKAARRASSGSGWPGGRGARGSSPAPTVASRRSLAPGGSATT